MNKGSANTFFNKTLFALGIVVAERSAGRESKVVKPEAQNATNERGEACVCFAAEIYGV